MATQRDLLPLVLDGIRSILLSKGRSVEPIDGPTPLTDLGLDSLDYAELLLHVELVTRVAAHFSPTAPIATVAELATHLQQARRQ